MIPEELIEEIAGRLRHHRHSWRGAFQRSAYEADEAEAEILIARIGKAVLDGGLDKWLAENMGLVGRAAWCRPGDEDHVYDWIADVIENGARTFIALRPGEEK